MAAKKKTRVAEGIYERGGSYQVAIYDAYEKRTVWLSGISSLKEARSVRETEKAKRKRRKKGSTEETCDHFALRWTRDYPRPSPETNLHNAERVKKFAQDFKGVKLSELTRAQGRTWALENRGRHKTIQAMFGDAVNDGILRENVLAKLKLPGQQGRKGKDIIKPDELKLLTDMARSIYEEGYGDVFASLIDAAAWTGLRPGELFALKHTDIDYEKGVIHVRQALRQKTQRIDLPKSGKMRDVALLPPAQEAFRYMKAHDQLGDGTIFYTKRGKPYTSRNHFFYWDKVRSAFWANLPEDRQVSITPDFDWYELRHFFGSQLARMGMTPYDIANQLGHQDGGRLAMSLYIHTESDEAQNRARIAYSEWLKAS